MAITKNIGSGLDYETLLAFTDNLGNAEFDGEDVIGVVHENQAITGARWAFTATGPLSVTIHPVAGGETDGIIGGSGIVLQATTHLETLYIQRNNVTIQDFSIRCLSSGAYSNLGVFIQNAYGGNNVLRNLIVGDGVSNANQNPTGISFFSTSTTPNIAANNIISGFRNPNTGAGRGIYCAYGAPKILNNTIYNCDTGLSLSNQSSSFAAVNNVTVNNTTDSNATTLGDIFYNGYTNGGTSWGTDAVELDTAANLFTDVTPGTEDLHLSSGSTAAAGAGIDTSGYSAFYTPDIDGDAVPTVTPDLGADQAAAPLPPGTIDVVQVLPTLNPDATVGEVVTGTLYELLPAYESYGMGSADVPGEITAVSGLPVIVTTARLTAEQEQAYARLDWVGHVDIVREGDAVKLDGVASGQMNLAELGRVLGAKPVATVPTAGAAWGLYDCSEAGSEGLYFSNGTDVVLIARFP